MTARLAPNPGDRLGKGRKSGMIPGRSHESGAAGAPVITLCAMGRHERLAAHTMTGATQGDALEIADLGAGVGRTSAAILLTATHLGVKTRLHAVDSASSLEDDVLRDDRVRSIIADLDQPLSFADGSLDRIVCVNVLEHLADPAALIAECGRTLKPGGKLVLAHSDWDTSLFAGSDPALTRRLVDRFVGLIPAWAERSDGFMGRKLLDLAAESPLEVLTVDSWADPHRRFDRDSIAWKIAAGVVHAAEGDPEFEAGAAAWLTDLQNLSQQGRFLFTVTDVAVVLERPNGIQPTA
jgi:SAM-dependent methyltransferase